MILINSNAKKVEHPFLSSLPAIFFLSQHPNALLKCPNNLIIMMFSTNSSKGVVYYKEITYKWPIKTWEQSNSL